MVSMVTYLTCYQGYHGLYGCYFVYYGYIVIVILMSLCLYIVYTLTIKEIGCQVSHLHEMPEEESVCVSVRITLHDHLH